ncbi:MAG: DUF4834 family protein [Alistipes sp.]
MRFVLAIIDALIRFVQRNPLTVLILVILAVGAPSLLKGIAVFILYFLLGLIVLVVGAMLLFRWKIASMRRQMDDQFDANAQGTPFGGERSDEREGDVKIYTTSETPDKKVSKDVGDYVEFEETKDEETKN